MSLATRCTSCGTVFRVVQDQLKVSEGWVRCGKCGEVFSALEGLFDLERDGPPQWTAPPAAAPSNPPERAQEPVFLPKDGEAERPAEAAQAVIDAPSESLASPDRPDFADARFDSEFESEAVASLRTESAPDTEAEPGSEFVESMLLADESAPAFIRHADRRARWQSPRARAGLTIGIVALALLAAGQAVHHFRDLIAATWPAARAPLFAWCGVVGCSIEPVRRIEDISVESTALTRSPAPDAFALSVTLRNRSAIGLATPSIELTLKEGEQAIARRVLRPDDFRTPLAVLPAGAESNLQLLLSAGNPRVNGYSVEIFYP